MGEKRFISEAVFYSRQDPTSLANFLHSIVRPVDIKADVPMSVSVENNTPLETVKSSMGTSLSIMTSGIPADVTVAWGEDTTPTYQQATAGAYVLDGTISGLPSNVTNTGSKKVKLTINVAEAEE